MTIAGRCRSSARGSRASAPPVVSPLDAGVDHLVPVPFGLQTVLQQGHPALLEPDPVGRAQAVPDDEDRR